MIYAQSKLISFLHGSCIFFQKYRFFHTSWSESWNAWRSQSSLSSAGEQRGSLNIPDTDRPRGRKRTEEEGKRERDREWSRESSPLHEFRPVQVSVYSATWFIREDGEPLNTLMSFIYTHIHTYMYKYKVYNCVCVYKIRGRRPSMTT